MGILRLVSVHTFAALSASALAAEPTEAQVDAAFKKADPDRDGTLNLADYVEALTLKAR